MKRNKAFTLIELVSVLVILAILALIVTPLVLNIIRKARTAADKRSIDAYGRSIELAIADYLLENGTFPTSIDELTIEYSGDRVVCSTTRLNEDSSVYLSECTVGGRIVAGYTYGKGGGSEEPETPANTSYSIGDQVTYNEVQYYVIKDSDVAESTVTLLKAEPLTYDEINTYGGVGTENNHVNMYVTSDSSDSYYHQTEDCNGYGSMAYYSSTTCNGYGDTSSCTTDYAQSEIKYVVDAWASSKVPNGLQEARLITYEELSNNLGYSFGSFQNSPYNWVYNENYAYWTMTQFNNDDSSVVYVVNNDEISFTNIYSNYHIYTVRPVIVLSKSALK